MPRHALLVVCLMLVLLTAAAFAFFMCQTRRRRRQALYRKPINILAAVTVVSPIGFLVPELVQAGRPGIDSECSLVQHLQATSTLVSVWLVLNFYLIRSNQVLSPTPLQRRLGSAVVVLLQLVLLYIVVAVNAEMVVRQVDGACLGLLTDTPTALGAYVLPCLLEGAVGVRFAWNIVRTMSATKSITNTSSMRRLLVVTCLVHLTTLIGDALVVLDLVGVLRLTADQPLISVQSTYKTCSVAWPAIIIGALKRSGDSGRVGRQTQLAEPTGRATLSKRGPAPGAAPSVSSQAALPLPLDDEPAARKMSALAPLPATTVAEGP